MARQMQIPVAAERVLMIGTGGAAVERRAYRDGEATGESVSRDGGTVRRLSGLAISLDGVGLDGAIVETTTPLEEVPAGTIFRPAPGSVVELTVRAVSSSSWDGSARADLGVTLYVQTVEPVGSINEVLAGGRRGRGQQESAA